ncbi:hypothetical protein, partial [Spirosoma aerophilum]
WLLKAALSNTLVGYLRKLGYYLGAKFIDGVVCRQRRFIGLSAPFEKSNPSQKALLRTMAALWVPPVKTESVRFRSSGRPYWKK